MILSSYKRLYKQDFQQQFQGLAEQLSNTINGAFDSLYSLAQGKISLRDNVLCEVKTFTLSVDSKGNPTTNTQVKMDSPGNIEGVVVLQVTNNTNNSLYPNAAVFVSWTANSNGILINNVTGLTPGNNYVIKLVIYQY